VAERAQERGDQRERPCRYQRGHIRPGRRSQEPSASGRSVSGGAGSTDGSGSVGQTTTSYLVGVCQCTPTAAKPQRFKASDDPGLFVLALARRPSPASKRRGLRSWYKFLCMHKPVLSTGLATGWSGPSPSAVCLCAVCADSPTLECNGPARPHSMSSCTWRASSEARMPDTLHSRCEPALPALLEADTGWICPLQRVEDVPRRCNGLGGRPIICVQMGWLSILAPPSAEVIHCDGGEHETSDSAQR
jgi:hypothetical protein